MERITSLLWLLFSAGGTVAALLFPVHFFLTALAFPLGWLEAPSYEFLHRLLTHPLNSIHHVTALRKDRPAQLLCPALIPCHLVKNRRERQKCNYALIKR